MVDAAIVMIENVHKHFEREQVTDKNRWGGNPEAADGPRPASGAGPCPPPARGWLGAGPPQGR